MFLIVQIIFFLVINGQRTNSRQPNVIMVIVDDWGWRDIGLRQHYLKTPYMDRMARQGRILTRHYTSSTCTPTRASLLTGRHPVELGLQHSPILYGQTTGVPRHFTLLPEHLQQCNYRTHLVGKWHLGLAHDWMRPERRGFDYFYGMLGGASDHYTREFGHHERFHGVDFSDGGKPSNATWNTEYSSHLYADKVDELLDDTEKKDPLFIYYSMQTVHYPHQAPKKDQNANAWINDEYRRLYAAMITATDNAIGKLERKLKSTGKWDNTLIVVMSDNGGDTRWGGSNYPLRGGKFTLLEGGIRTTSFISGGAVDWGDHSDYEKLFHISD